jgi:hypothetical protein
MSFLLKWKPCVRYWRKRPHYVIKQLSNINIKYKIIWIQHCVRVTFL